MNRKNNWLLALLMLPTWGLAQEGFVIKGKVGVLDKPAKAYLSYPINGQRHLDSTDLKEGAFVFNGSVDSPKEAHIRVKHDDVPDNPAYRPDYDVIGFFIENKTITITAKDSVKNGKIGGSPINDDNINVTEMLKPYYDQYKVLDDEYMAQSKEKQNDKSYVITLEDRAKKIQDQITAAKLNYVKTHPNSYMALMALNSALPPEFDAIIAEKNFDLLTSEIKDTELGRDLYARINKMKQTQEGALAPDFTQQDVAGKPVKLSDFRGKYVLLDFWASWCAPCRRENPNLVKTYAKYKEKGFEILGVSLDKPNDREKWTAAIEKDSLSWTQVSDLKAWDNEAAKLYDVKAIPMNFLIDPTGKIIAKSLRGEELNAKLDKVLSK